MLNMHTVQVIMANKQMQVQSSYFHFSTNAQKLPVRTDTNARHMATAFQQTVIATFQLQYPMPMTSDPKMKNKQIKCLYQYLIYFYFFQKPW